MNDQPHNGFRLPTDTERAAIVGRTGSGKTFLGAWILSGAPFHRQPYIIADFKRDELLNSIRRTREIGLKDIPKHPGLYIIRLRPGIEDDIEAWLWKVWQRGRIGLYFDETYLMPDKAALQTILTQGRSLRIPAICVSQRPVQVSRFVFTEADHVAIFHLNDERDEETVRRFTPRKFLSTVPAQWRDNGDDGRLPEHHFRWYDIKKDRKYYCSPVPSADQLISAIDTRLEPKRTWL